MSNYCFYDGTITGVEKTGQYAAPGDTSEVKVRRGWVDTTKQTLNASDVARVFPVYADEIILAAGLRVKTADATSNCAVDLGVDGGYEFGADLVVTAANSVEVNISGYYVAANGNFTLVPNNAVAVDAGVFEVFAIITKAFDKM